jgi:uncharacterized repeat protein (TIGR03803 family)
LQAKDGTWYGVTEFGGTAGAGTVYQITGSTYKILHSFIAASGSYPVGGLVEGADGNFYGTTTAGGTSTAGVIYRITPTGTYTDLYNFNHVSPSVGYQSYAGLIAGADGNLYGVTIWGGLYGGGVVFSMTTGGAYTELYSFDTPTGVGAYTTPVQHTNGEIFGMTARDCGIDCRHSGPWICPSHRRGIQRNRSLISRDLGYIYDRHSSVRGNRIRHR